MEFAVYDFQNTFASDVEKAVGMQWNEVKLSRGKMKKNKNAHMNLNKWFNGRDRFT